MRKLLEKTKFGRSIGGMAAIEFAIILPFLLLVLFGTYQITYYVITVRKIDNVVNDVGYIISREGCIASDFNGTCITPLFTGGQDRLHDIFDNVIPFLIYPYAYNPGDDKSQIQVKFVGLPQVSSCPSSGGSNSDGVNRDTVRVMWIEKYPATSATAISGTNNVVTDCNSVSCPDVCDNGTYGKYQSFYSDDSASRANIIYPSQSFILVNFAFDFKGVLGANMPFLGTVLPSKFEKSASYASRSRWIDINNDQLIQTTELVNYLNYCTDCNIATSKYGGASANMKSSNEVYRQPCIASTGLNAGQSNNTNNSSGCVFY